MVCVVRCLTLQFPVTAAREIKLLKSMCHENIVRLEQICTSSAESVYLVFEYLEFDLAGLLQHPQGAFGVAQIKCIVHQLLEALQYLHGRCVVHRDVKGSNVLLGRDGRVKLADFGLAKVFVSPDRAAAPAADGSAALESNRMMTNRVITLWYRPPEVLLGSTDYGPEVDVWGVGCILLELLAGRPVFAGQDELSQLDAICRRLGPVPATVPSLARLPWFRMMSEALVGEPSSPSSPSYGDYLAEEFGDRLGAGGLDLVRRLLALDPAERIRSSQALKHAWFSADPPRCAPADLVPKIDGDWHEFECKLRSRKSSAHSLRPRPAADLEASASAPAV